ncbi:hypothetical protein [Mycobacteroides chelonae]|uniref:hypothetical protein n=1 Tax=Mycobacteroides TaxID=670516 RepID=UPI000F4D90D4|nr:hypothetical protein [Mycobacteroides chelonae]
MNYSVNSKSTDSDNIPTQVWVVDAVSGRIVANSLTELRPSESVAAPHIGVQQVGDYLVALLPGVGWRGVGENGELTWQVSGEGRTLRTVDRRYFPGDPAVPIGVGNTGGASAVAFSAVDGKEFSSDGGEWIDPIVGGFVVSGPSIRFFDEKGVKRGEFKSDKNASWEPASNGQLAIMSVSDIVGSGVKQVVFNSSGTKIAELNTHSLGSSIRVIGDYIFTGSDNEKDGPAVWKKFSLRSGKAISECSGIGLSRSSFVGSDGTVVIGKIDSPVSSDRDIVRAVDSNSCEPVWEVEGHPALTAVNETLIQTSESEVFSLVSS